jgi:hypothetical protein
MTDIKARAFQSRELESISNECTEIVRILSRSIKTSEERQGEHKIKRRKP